jgi:phospholipid/cholesterol/gamma-HCH transport system substrate-binding protein
MRAFSGRLLGIAFLAMLLAFGWLTYAIYTKKFVDIVPAEVHTSNVGLQLNKRADVKLRGVIVGEVRSIDVVGDGAVLNLAMDPGRIDDIPANVSALIVPKTLFGEKYVALQMPDEPSSKPLAADGVISQAEVPIEVEEVLTDIYPLLQAVRPADLSATLNAMATALEGRGDRIGDNFVRLNGYLTKFNPLVPQLVDDLEALGEVSDVYADIMPELARLLENSTFTGKTVVAQEAELRELLTSVDALAVTTEQFLVDNGEALEEVGRTSTPITDLLARYSPEFPCLFQGLVGYTPRAAESFRGHTLHIVLETLPTQPRAYGPPDDPVYNAEFGPGCQSLPTPPYSQQNPGPQPGRPVVESGGVEGSHGKFRASPQDVGAWLSERQPSLYDDQRTRNRLSTMLGMPSDTVPDVSGLLLGSALAGER